MVMVMDMVMVIVMVMVIAIVMIMVMEKEDEEMRDGWIMKALWQCSYWVALGLPGSHRPLLNPFYQTTANNI